MQLPIVATKEKHYKEGITFLKKHASGELELLPGAEDIFKTVKGHGEEFYYTRNLPDGWDDEIRKVTDWDFGKLYVSFGFDLTMKRRSVSSLGYDLSDGPEGDNLKTVLILVQAIYMNEAIKRAGNHEQGKARFDLVKGLRRELTREFHPDKWGKNRSEKNINQIASGIIEVNAEELKRLKVNEETEPANKKRRTEEQKVEDALKGLVDADRALFWKGEQEFFAKTTEEPDFKVDSLIEADVDGQNKKGKIVKMKNDMAQIKFNDGSTAILKKSDLKEAFPDTN